MAKIIESIFDYFIVPGTSTITFVIVGLWWKGLTGTDLRASLFLAIVFLMIFLNLTFSTGYKGYFLRDRRVYYYSVFILPLVFSIFGFIYGLIAKHY